MPMTHSAYIYNTHIPQHSFIPMNMESTPTMFFMLILLFIFLSQENTPSIDPLEQKAFYQVLNSLNPTIPWPTLYPNDLCHSPPPGVVCDYYLSSSSSSDDHQQRKSHIVELNFGYISDQTPTPPCSFNATLNPLLFTSFTYLRKLSFYKCFNRTEKPIHLISLPSFPISLQQLVFVDNPAIVSPLEPFLTNLTTSLKSLVIIGNGFYGELPPHIGDFLQLEELILSRSNLSGQLPASLGMLKKLKILDLSHNEFEGSVPEQLGNLISLLKLDLSFNGFCCKIPESFIHLKNLEFLDLSFNNFGNFGVPLFLGEFSKLNEVYLSGNSLSGEIPEIWKKLGGVEKIGFSKMGLVGKIPVSMGVYLKNLTYLGLDNNMLDGPVPEEFGHLKFADEINLENNNLSGRITFSCEVGDKFKLGGNVGICLGKSYSCSGNGGCSLCQLNPCQILTNDDNVIAADDDDDFSGYSMLFMMMILVVILCFWSFS